MIVSMIADTGLELETIQYKHFILTSHFLDDQLTTIMVHYNEIEQKHLTLGWNAKKTIKINSDDLSKNRINDPVIEMF